MKKRLMVRVMAYFLSAMMCVCLLYGNETGVKAAVKPKLSSRKIVVRKNGTKVLRLKNVKSKTVWKVTAGKKNIALSAKSKNSVKIKGKCAGKATVCAITGGRKLICRVVVRPSNQDEYDDEDDEEEEYDEEEDEEEELTDEDGSDDEEEDVA